MSHTPLNGLIKTLVKKQIDLGNLKELTSKTGLSKHWFYEVSKDGIKDPRTSAVSKFLQAIEHPIHKEIQLHIESSEVDEVA